MAIRVTYKKNILTGPKSGESYSEQQDLTTSAQALHFQRLLAEVTDMFPAEDPVTKALCYVSEIKSELLHEDDRLTA